MHHVWSDMLHQWRIGIWTKTLALLETHDGVMPWKHFLHYIEFQHRFLWVQHVERFNEKGLYDWKNVLVQ